VPTKSIYSLEGLQSRIIFFLLWLSDSGLGGFPGWQTTTEPQINYGTALAIRRSHCWGALAPACVGLSRRGNEARGLAWKPRRAGPVGRHCGVVAVAKGGGHCLPTMPCFDARQTPAEQFQNWSEVPWLVRCSSLSHKSKFCQAILRQQSQIFHFFL